MICRSSVRGLGFERNSFYRTKEKIEDLEARKLNDLQVYLTPIPTFGDYAEDLEGGG